MKQIQKLVEIARALKPARQDMREFHVCGIFKGNQLVSLATNTKKTHPFSIKNHYPYPAGGSHAEMLAVLRGKQEDYKGHKLFVLRLDNNGKIAYSKPCKFCENLILNVNFDEVLFSMNEHVWFSWEKFEGKWTEEQIFI